MLAKDSNASFYSNMPLDIFMGFAEKIGLSEGEDVDQIYEDIKESSLLIEFGSGYGRVIQALKTKNFQGQIVGIERVHELTEILKEKASENITIVEDDLCYLDWHREKADTILWMWSGILELTPDDQQKVITKAYDMLVDGGQLIIECPFNDSISKVGMLSNDKKIVVKEAWGVLDATLVESNDIENYSSNAGFSSHSLRKYETTTNLTRAIYTLIK
ncbi:bifunctional 2-polyprenyl-6-hydroxyphenol methylase/3-demethylubiquinol 3-O-methyltransferase UbiG [Flammeovirga sp. EKP202]|uniref:class I SAM-dependent methyltransferase n=1 Tax=Flammeovirga sp. EKP202 TaxID=2770592 RepID=UPI00165EF812|nr:class I SAM-dependent methyltransferase [Flammeovirga sp. EKP202]MBD0402821.1 class I SAM-dependent methyltransferase [Flammeovirga sp. EKP202]